MRICIFGSGAVGSHLAVRLALAGHDVSCVMRGPHLEAVKANGLKLRVGDAEVTARVKASDDPGALGPQDVVISTLKATGVSSLATGLAPLLREDTPSCSRRTGFRGGTISGCPRIIRGLRISLSRSGRPSCALPSRRERIIGGVIFSSNEIVAPGVVANLSPERNMLLVGECDDRHGLRIELCAPRSTMPRSLRRRSRGSGRRSGPS